MNNSASSQPRGKPARNWRIGRIALWTLMLIAALSIPAFTESRVESRAIPSTILGRSVRYAVLLPPGYDDSKTRRYPVLYYLHGLGDNEQTLVRSGGWDIIEHLQESNQIGEFIIVTPDGRQTFYINSRDGRERYEDFFIKEFVPAIERRYRALGTRAGRGISGTSMGGYGALRFAFRYPNLFVSVSAHMAALAEEMPDNLISGFGSGLDAFGKPFNAAYWKENTPFTLLRHSKGLGDLKIYFDCGEQDDFGFYTGARALHELLQKHGVAHEYHLYPGRHNGEFVAAHFPASIRLHSRAFGLSK